MSEGESWTVTPTGQAQISTRGVSGGPLQAPTTIATATTFGPYAESGTLTIFAMTGSATYTGSELSALVSGYGTPVVVDASGNLLNSLTGAAVNGPSYIWAARPAAAGNTGRVVRISDIGPGGSFWYSDGTNWRPVGGSVLIASQQGSITTPLSAFTGVTSSVFTITPPVIPAGMLIPGSSTIEFEAQLRRTGATATALLNVHFGTSKSTSDNPIYAFTYAATTLLDLLVNPSVLVAETSRIVASNWQTRGGSGNAGVFQERTGNINTAADMGITIGIASANAADSFALLGYKVRVIQ